MEYQTELFLELISQPFESRFQPFLIEEGRPELKGQGFCVLNSLLDEVNDFISSLPGIIGER
jgi:hypothetical protein